MKGLWLFLVASWGLIGCHADENAQRAEVSASEKPNGVEKHEPAPEKPAPVPTPAASLSGSLTLSDPSGKKSVVSLDELRKEYSFTLIESNDPNYEAKKTFYALPLGPLLKKHFSDLEGARLLLQASDGYSVEVEASLLLSDDAFLAVGDRKPGEFSPIGPRKVKAGPLYVIWRGDKYMDDKKYPRPWALVSIEKLDSSDRYEHTRPEDGFGEDELAEKGYSLFSKSCIRCHAINREGGRLGPDLNVPQNILAYRPEKQVRDYIRDPENFRYSTMPAHPDFEEKDLDALVAYLRLMGEHQHDPDSD